MLLARGCELGCIFFRRFFLFVLSLTSLVRRFSQCRPAIMHSDAFTMKPERRLAQFLGFDARPKSDHPRIGVHRLLWMRQRFSDSA